MAAPSTGVTWVNSGLAGLIRSDRAGGLEEPTAQPYPRAVLKDVGEAVMDKKNADALFHRADIEALRDARAGGGVTTRLPRLDSRKRPVPARPHPPPGAPARATYFQPRGRDSSSMAGHRAALHRRAPH